jgi:hypothetical protein
MNKLPEIRQAGPSSCLNKSMSPWVILILGLALDDNAALTSPKLLRSRPIRMSKGNASPPFFGNLEDCFLLGQAVAS